MVDIAKESCPSKYVVCASDFEVQFDLNWSLSLNSRFQVGHLSEMSSRTMLFLVFRIQVAHIRTFKNIFNCENTQVWSSLQVRRNSDPQAHLALNGQMNFPRYCFRQQDMQHSCLPLLLKVERKINRSRKVKEKDLTDMQLTQHARKDFLGSGESCDVVSTP